MLTDSWPWLIYKQVQQRWHIVTNMSRSFNIHRLVQQVNGLDTNIPYTSVQTYDSIAPSTECVLWLWTCFRTVWHHMALRVSVLIFLLVENWRRFTIIELNANCNFKDVFIDQTHSIVRVQKRWASKNKFIIFILFAVAHGIHVRGT